MESSPHRKTAADCIAKTAKPLQIGAKSMIKLDVISFAAPNLDNGATSYIFDVLQARV